MTSQGKIDKRKLQQEFSILDPNLLELFSRGSNGGEMDEQMTEQEQIIAEALAAVVGVPKSEIRHNTSFFNIGLDSISAIPLSRLLRKAGLGQIDVSTILRHSSIRRLCSAIYLSPNGHIAKLELNQTKSITQVFGDPFLTSTKELAGNMGQRVRDILPCTPLQEVMLVKCGHQTAATYFNHTLLRIHGDIDRLKEAWSEMIHRHDILRTCFVSTDDLRYPFAQVVLKDFALPWTVTKVSTDLEIEIKRLQTQTAATKDDFQPLWSLNVVDDTENDQSLLLLSMHHALYDAEAMKQLLREIEQLVQGVQLNPPVPFKNLLCEIVSLDDQETDKFWSNQLADFEPHRWTDFTTSSSVAFEVTHSSPTFSLSWIENECRNQSTSLLPVFQATWVKLLCAYFGSDDVCLGNVFSCRTLPVEGVERIVGPCFNTLPIRAKVRPNLLNKDLVSQLQKTNLEILPFQLSSLRRIQSRTSTQGQRLFDSLLLLQGDPPKLNERIWSMESEKGCMDFPIILEIAPHRDSDRLSVSLHFDRSYMSSQDSSITLEHFAATLQSFLRFPSGRVSDSSLLINHLPSFAGKLNSEKSDRHHTELENGELQGRPWSKKEQEIQTVLSELSETAAHRISLDTTIFQLGLDSINAIQVSAQLRKQGNVVSAADVLEAPSVRQLASLIESRRMEVRAKAEVFDFDSFDRRRRPKVCQQLDIEESSVEAVKPCTPVQSGILSEYLNSDGELYLNHVVAKIDSSIGVEALQAAWERASSNFEMLRTGFIHSDDTTFPFMMVVYRGQFAKLPWKEVNNMGDRPFNLLHIRDSEKKDVLAALHLPAWRITHWKERGSTHFQFSAHHALYDAQSLSLIFNHVAAVLQGTHTKSELPISRTLGMILIQSARDDRASKFWQSLRDRLCVTKFPDLNTCRVQSTKSLFLKKTCSISLDKLQRGCKEAGITLQAAGQAAWAQILSSYSGEPAITFGLVLSGRDISEEARDVAFPCLVTIPFPCRVSGNNQDLIRQIMKLNASIIKHQFTPLAKIERFTGTGKALFDSIFVYQKLSGIDSLEKPWEIIEEAAKVNYPVSIELIPSENKNLEFYLTFQEKRLPREQACIILDQLDALLISAIFEPQHELVEISALDSRLLSILPPKVPDIQSDIQLLHEFVEFHARKCRDKVALEFATSVRDDGKDMRSWTYKELNSLGNQYAHLIRSVGGAQGDLIGICFDKRPEAYFAILGILKAGCAYVALDPGAPIARKTFVVKDSNSSMILCTTTHMQDLQQIDQIPIVAVDESGLLNNLSRLPPELTPAVSPKNTCYCLYTSGTTGTPKGCEITHENAVQAMLSFQRLFKGHWDADSRWLQFASFHFDVSVLEQYWSWSVGICVTSAPRDVIFEDIAETISRLQITHIDLTPSLARLLHPDDVPSLCRGVFITGGEQLKQEILDAWGDKGVIYNGYGPTEVTIGCTMYPRVPRNAKASNIGPQFDNVGSYVMKVDSIVPVLRGGVGELCVSGKLVGRGYLNRPDLTAQKFQILESTGERVYRTGDLVRLLHEGSFEFMGRIDDQVKLRGQRLEIAEIDQVIKNGAGYEVEVATLVLKHPNQAKDQLVSFVCKSAGRKRSDSPLLQSEGLDRVLMSSVRAACLERLPGYMVPTYILSVSTMPLSPNNKIDTKQLRYMYEATSIENLQQLSSLGDDSSSVHSEDIRRIIEVIAQQLELQPSDVNARSNLFELGLDSISAISFAKALKQAGFVKARASLIMKNQVIFRLATALSSSVDNESGTSNAQRAAEQNILAFSHRHAYSVSESLNVDLDSIENIAPCTPLQEGMIYRSLNSDRPVYFSSFAFRLGDDVNLDRLKIAWKQIQSATQILRTRFVLTPDGYAQVVLKKPQLDWKIVSIDEDEILTDIIGDHGLEFWRHGRDLSGILWKVVILEHEASSVMTLHIFHSLYDGNSLPLMLDLLDIAYTKGEAITQTPSFHQTLTIGPLCETLESKTFWTQHLDKAHVRPLPLKEEIEDTSPSMATLKIQPPSGFQRTRRQLHVTDQSLIQASWVMALAKWFKFVPTLGVVVSGRSIDMEEAERVIGPMFNTIPCHIQLLGIKLWSDLVQKCHEFNVSSMLFQHTPLRSIMKWCKRSQHEPLFDTLFVYQKAPVSAQDRKKLWTQVDMPSEPDYPLAFEAQMNGDGTLSLTIVAQGGVLSSEEAQSMLEVVEKYLSALIRNPMAALPPEITNELRGVDPAILPEISKSSSARSNSDRNFLWTERALQIRKTISALAEVDEDKVRHDISIFELGLDSIDAIRLSSRLRKSEMKISVSAIMRFRSIEKMCEKLEESDVDERPPSEKSINSWELELKQYLVEMGHDLDDIEYVLPPTPLQEAMIAEMVASDYEHYFNHDVLEIEPGVDTERLLESWKTLVQINAVLRTSFTEIDSPDIPLTYVQIVKKSRQLQFRILDAADDEEFAVQVDRQQKHQPTGLHEHMFRVTLVRGPKKSVLLLSVAHALYDGWSLGLLHQDVRSLYAGDMPRRPSYRETLDRILNASGDGAARFWRGTLAGVPATSYPSRLSDKSISVKVHRIGKHSQVSVQQAKTFCQSHGITPQALGLTCWAFVLAHNVKRLDVVCGVVLSGRDTDEASEVMFPTMNTVAVRSVIHGTRGEMARYVQDGLVNVNKYQHYPLRKAMAGTSLGLFNTLFIYQRRPESQEMDSSPLYRSIGGSSEVEVSISGSKIPLTVTNYWKYPVCLELEIEGENLIWRTACKDDFLNESGTKSLLDQIDNVLRSIIEHSEEPAIMYSGQETSICGLPSFIINKPSAGERPQETGETLEADESEWSPFEMETRSVLSSVSGVPEANIRKSMTLFHLGLDSISAIKVSSLLRKRSIIISVSKMLQVATVQNIASAAQSVRDVAQEKPPDTETTIRQMLSGIYLEQLLGTLDLPPSEVERVMPATAGQIFMLSAWQNSEGAIFYPTFHYEMHGDLDPSALDEAWSNLVRQVPILRTRFYGTGQKNHPFLQVVEKSCDNAIFWISESEQSDLETHHNPQNPMASPPVSLFAYKKPGSTTLSLRIHHALYDGVSLPKLIHRLEDLCNNWVPRHETHVNLADFIAFSHTHSDLTKRQSFWKIYLKHDSRYLPTISNATLCERSDIYHPRLIEDVGPLESVARQNGISIQSIFLAGYARVYSRMLQNSEPDERPLESIVVGVYLANRSHSLDGLSDLIAPTMNLVPLLIKHAADGSLIGVARTIQKDLQEIGNVEHSNVSLVEIEEWTAVKVDCFVNFLKLPDMERKISMIGDSKKERRIRITEVDREGKKAPAISLTLDNSQHVLRPNQMGKNLVSDIYIVSPHFLSMQIL
jgi:ferricrocin synthase